MSKNHEIETTTEVREITRRTCRHEGCSFYGQEAQQGICHTTNGDLVEWSRLDAHERELIDSLKQLREREGSDYVSTLEAHYVGAMMNWQLTLDECIRLRRDRALAEKTATATTGPDTDQHSSNRAQE